MGGGVGFLSAVAISMSSRRGPPSSQNRMTEGGLRQEDGKKKAEKEEWKGREEGVQDKHGLDSAGDTSRESESEASVGSETKQEPEQKKYFCRNIGPFLQRNSANTKRPSRSIISERAG